MSKYDEIKTAKDLIREVISNGMSTVQEDTNRAADIFGNTSVEILADLANSEESISGKLKGLTFFRSYYNAARELPDKQRLALYDAIMEYGFDGVEPELTGTAKSRFTSIRSSLNKRSASAK